MKYTSSWSAVGGAGFTPARADYTNLAIAPDGTPYLAYDDWNNNYKSTVMKYGGSSWATVGSAGFSAAEADYVSLAIAPNGSLYVAYQDYGASYGATVMRLAVTGAAHTVTYSGNGSTGGSVPTDSNSYLSGATVTVLGNTGSLVKTGYTFAGWNTAADGTGTTYTVGNTFPMGAANVTLYAKWTINSYTVTYDGNGNTGGTAPVDGSSHNYNTTVTVLGNTGSLVRTGYTFVGWNTAANGSGTDYAASGSATFTMGAANVTLYAKWTINPTLTVTFAGNGGNKVESTSPDQNINCLKGSSSGCSASYAIGTPVTLKATPDWKSTFMGWSGDYISSDNPGTVTVTANKTVIATFDPIYKVRLMPNTDFASIQDAYDSAADGAEIRAQEYFFLEPAGVTLGNVSAWTITLKGGYKPDDANFDTVTGLTTVQGPVNIERGSLTVERLIIR